MTFKEQMGKAGSLKGMSMTEAVEAMNRVVVLCPPKKNWWQFWVRQHDKEDITHLLNTMTYTVASRCTRCGLIEISSGL